MKQKEIFLEIEGNNWHERNNQAIKNRNFELDSICKLIEKIDKKSDNVIFEVGCSAGQRLEYLASLGYIIGGIEPSESAVKNARLKGLDVFQGTADELKIDDNSVDILIFGFCLYLVDPSDYFKIASEAYRVIRDNGFIIIHDFAPKTYYKKDYKHLEGINSYKFDFTQILLAHPHLVLKSKTTEIHSNLSSDVHNQDEWVQISLIGKQKSLF
jgi:ubiquinone/menaquinone biosynthesis C-methylase UbiE